MIAKPIETIREELKNYDISTFDYVKCYLDIQFFSYGVGNTKMFTQGYRDMNDWIWDNHVKLKKTAFLPEYEIDYLLQKGLITTAALKKYMLTARESRDIELDRLIKERKRELGYI